MSEMPSAGSMAGSLTAPYPAPATSVGKLFLDRTAATPGRTAFRAPAGGGTWRDYSWADTEKIVTELAAGLIAAGLQVEDRVGIACNTRVEWIFADLAIMCAGCAATSSATWLIRSGSG